MRSVTAAKNRIAFGLALVLISAVGASAYAFGASTTPPGSVGTTERAATDVVGAAWEPATGNLAGMASECGNLSYLSSRPDRDELIAGIAQQGLWSSADGGATWTALGQGAGSDVVTHRLASIRYDPVNPDTFWISGTYNGRSAFVTSDGGLTFHQLGQVLQGEILDIDFGDPARQTMLITIHEKGLVARSTDGGATWVDISAGLPDEADIGIAEGVVVIDALTHLYGTGTEAGSGIFRTVDGGTTWTTTYQGGVIGQPLRSLDGALYWTLEGSDGVVASTDGGATWRLLPGAAISNFSKSLIELPDGRFATFSDNYVILSEDHGATWRAIEPALPFDPNGLVYSPFQHAFFIWKFDCHTGAGNPVLADSIMRLDFTPAS